MAWKVEFDPSAERELDKIDKQSARRILAFLYNRIANGDNPRSIGKALKGSELGNFWRYRVGDWRIIVSIDDNSLRILVMRIGNRKDIYR